MTLVNTLLATETTGRAIEVARQSGIQSQALSEMLTKHADRVRGARPAAAAAAEFLARLVNDLEIVRPWGALDHLSDAQNDLLHRASLTNGMDTFRLLRKESEYLNEDVMTSVLAWHAGLAQKGVPAPANGAGLVATVGVILGGVSQALAHMAWARHCETVSLARAERHLVRAQKLMRSAGNDEGQEVAAAALNSFYARLGGRGTPHAPPPVSTSRPALSQIPINESRAADLRDAGRYRESLAVLDASIPVALEAGIMPSAMRMLALRGLVHDDLSEYAQSEEDFREASRLAGQLGDEDRRFEALNNSAASFLKRGEPRRALPAFRAILRSADANDDDAKRVAARNNLATAYAWSGDHRRARDLYLEALRLMGESSSTSRWIALGGLATAQDRLSDHQGLRDTATQLWGWAERGYEGALTAYLNSAACDLSRPNIATTADKVWHSYVERGHVLEAAELSLRLARRDAETDPDRSLGYLDALLNAFSSERSEIAALIAAETEAAKLEAGVLGRPEGAVSRLRAGVDRVERRLADVDSPSEADWLLDAARPLYVGLLHLLLQDGDPDSLPEAVWLHEACRPATLTSSHGAGPAPTSTGLRGRVADLDTVDHVLATQSGQRLAVLSYYEAEAEVGAFIFRSGSPAQRVRLDVAPTELDEATKQLSIAFNGDPDAFPPRRPPAARDVDAVDLALADRVLIELGRAASTLEGPEVVCVIPSPQMDGLPLHAVQLPSGRRLIQEFGVVQHPSLSSFVTTARLATSKTPPRTIFVAGVAATEDRHPEFFEADHAAFAERPGVRTLTGEDVTPEAVIDGLRSAEVAHVSSHGFVDMRDPLGSGLLLSDGKRRPSRRTQSVPIFERPAFELTVRQLMEQKLETQLLTLRACSTAKRSSIAAKNEMSTLTRVLHAAGCRTVISTLWNVDQRSSLQLFERFYSMYLDAEMPPCDAMAQAQRELLSSGPPHSHLYHWAPFVLSGDWRRP